jgi:uridine kinase
MLLEGVSALRNEFRRFLSAGVFITAPREICLKRGLQRDAWGGSTANLKKLWDQYYNDEEGYLRRDNPQAYADLVFDGTQPFECQFDMGC